MPTSVQPTSAQPAPVQPAPVQPAPKKRRAWPIWRILACLIIVAALFGLGVAVGRGNIRVERLSLDTKGGLDYSSVDQVYAKLKSQFDGNIDASKLINGAKSGLVSAAGDPYTVFFNPADAKAFNDQLAGTIIGIGAELGSDEAGHILIISPLSGYPAEKAGLKPKDIIAAINGASTNGMSIDAAVSKIRGEAGTVVKLTIVRGTAPAFEVSITRQKITIASVKYHEDGNIGYLKVSQFSNDTVDLVQKAANEFKAKGVKGVVLDLRGDPGGYLSGAVSVSSLWLEKGKTVVSERRGATIVDNQVATGNNTLGGLPTIILIDSGSASASEITAGALHDNGAATLVGETSFGKGSVQQVDNFADGSELKVTIAHWYTPNGKNINKQGIKPDVQVAADPTGKTDPQKDKAYQLLQAKIGG